MKKQYICPQVEERPLAAQWNVMVTSNFLPPDMAPERPKRKTEVF